MINNTGKYKLIKYEGVNIVLNNKECDNTYKTRISSWVNGARCECETDYTIPKLRKIFANEYPEFEIIDYHNERLYLKHKACGQEFDVTMKNWKKKQSCRICDPRFELNVATVGKAVEEKGFKLIKGEFLSQNRMITIECPEGHRKEVGYYSFMEYSACPVCNVLNNSIEGLATKFIKENYTEDDVVYLADLKQVVENPRSEYLTRLGYKKIATGMYCRHDLTDEEIIEQKYLYRKKHIGYSYGESFAYELGMMNKPEIYSCCTLMDSGPKGRFVQIRDTKLRIKGVIKGFDSDYWREWQLLDFLYAVNKYRGNKTIDEVIDLIMDHINSHDLNKEYLIGNMIDKKSIYIDGIMEKLHEKKKQEN